MLHTEKCEQRPTYLMPFTLLILSQFLPPSFLRMAGLSLSITLLTLFKLSEHFVP